MKLILAGGFEVRTERVKDKLQLFINDPMAMATVSLTVKEALSLKQAICASLKHMKKAAALDEAAKQTPPAA